MHVHVIGSSLYILYDINCKLLTFIPGIHIPCLLGTEYLYF